jgi:hypothetical protein
MESIIEIKNKINHIKQQISIRTSVPEHERTTKQSIKLDNLLYELKILQELVK